MKKSDLRQMMKEKLKSITSDQYERWSQQIAEKLFQTVHWRTANTIGVTISKGKEVDTKAIIQKGWEQGKTIVVPKCMPKTRNMKFRTIESFDQLEIVYFGLQEPIESVTNEVSNHQIDLLIVPGLIYSYDGFRIGFGGGYYDRFLNHFPNKTVSLAFDIQLVDELPVEKHDLAVNMIITNKRVLSCI